MLALPDHDILGKANEANAKCWYDEGNNRTYSDFICIFSFVVCDAELSKYPTNTTTTVNVDSFIPNNTTESAGDRTVEATVSGPVGASNITFVGGVSIVTLNNGVHMPCFDLDTQIKRLGNGELSILNHITYTFVVFALQAGYCHLDMVHGYVNEHGVGQLYLG